MSRSWLKNALGSIGRMSTLWLGHDNVRILHGVPGRGKDGNDDESEAVMAEAGADTSAWFASLQALQRLLERQAQSSMPQRLQIVVSNEFVRYVLTPWTAETLSESERVELVRALLVDRYGERDSNWHIVVEPQQFEMPSLAAAIDAGFFEALHALCSQKKLRLVSLVPALVANLNTQRSLLANKKAGWYVDAGDGRLVVLAFSSEGWTNVSNERTDGRKTVAETLLPVLRRDSIRTSDLLDGTVFIPTACGEMASITQSWPVIRLNSTGLQVCA